MSAHSFLARVFLALERFSRSHHRLVILVALGVLAIGSALSMTLVFDTDVMNLLPQRDKAVKAFRETAEDFWETGASGRRYSREFVWATLKGRYESSDKDEFEVERWETRDFHLREIAAQTYLLTYTLWGQGDRLTRRLTVWQGSVEDGWKTLYHQGTVVT